MTRRTHPVVVASNRGPLAFAEAEDGSLEARRGSGGLVSGLTAALAGTEGAWVCAALNAVDRRAARLAPDGWLGTGGGTLDHPPVRMLDIPTGTYDRAYNAIANSFLWFVHHMLFDLPTAPVLDSRFRADWEAYRAYNAAFADACATAAADGGTVLVQDYHLALAPAMLRGLRPDVRLLHFSHTPWAPSQYFAILPADVRRDILRGMLGADVLGFHTRRWADAFLRCAHDDLGPVVDWSRSEVDAGGRTVRVVVEPPGVDVPGLRERASRPDVTARRVALREHVQGRRVLLRVDRLDPSKNAVRGLLAYRELLATRPEWRGAVVHVALLHSSRAAVPAYQEYATTLARTAQELRAAYETPSWTPLVLTTRDDYAGSLAGFCEADVLLVNPVRDGLNLVAMEGPALSAHGQSLVLSREAGAATLLPSAALVNPYDISETADALDAALRRSPAERRQTSASLAVEAGRVTPTSWLAALLRAASAAG